MPRILSWMFVLGSFLYGCADAEPDLDAAAGSGAVIAAGVGAVGESGRGDAAMGGAGMGGRMPAAEGGRSALDAGMAGSAADAGRAGAGGSTREPDAGAAGSGDAPAEVRYMGRVDLSDPAGGKFAWSGSGVAARFRGTSLAVSLSGGQEYSVVIDGVLRPNKLTILNGVTPVASDLSDSVHEVALYRRTEANQGVSQFRGFSFSAGGALLAAPSAPSRRLELIGDSISVGYGNEGPDQNCKFTPQTENHYQSYGAMAARTLDAELHTIAWSGRGVVCNYGDDAQSCSDPFPNVYDRTLPTVSDSRWDFSRYQPQAIVINLGTNDYSTEQDPSEAQFTSAYRAFLEHLRSKYSDALILCTCGPLLYGAELDLVRGYIANAVAATADKKIKTFDIPSQSESDGLGCDYHPSIKTHQKMADLLVSVLERELGW